MTGDGRAKLVLLGYDETALAAKLDPPVKSSVQCLQTRTPGFAWNRVRRPAAAAALAMPGLVGESPEVGSL